jgi:hypothetical protein
MDQTVPIGLREMIRTNNHEKKQITKMELIHASIFYTIVLWLAFYFLVLKHKLVFKEATWVTWAAIIGINLLIIAVVRFLVPLFNLILIGTSKIGSFIFATISTIVFFFILTPIALFKRLTGKKLIETKIEKEKESYYEPWEPAEDIEKQY